MSRRPAGIVVLEQRPRWSPALRRAALAGVWACRSLSDVRSRVQSCQADGRACLAVLDLETGATTCLALVAALRSAGLCGVVCIGTVGSELLEPSLRELGATSVHFPPLSASRLVHECRRLLRGQGL